MNPPQTNRLLNALSAPLRERVLKAAKLIDLPLRTTLMEAEESLNYVYFPTSGIASVVIELKEGGTAEVSLISREGVVGGMNLLGPFMSPARCFMQVEGMGYRLPYAEAKRIFLDSAEFRERVLEMVQQQALTITQLAACNRLHDAEARLARWLLMVRDRLQQNTMFITQEFLAEMLGTQRTTVVMAAGAFQRSGLLHYSRGKVTITSPDDLEDAACDCYKIIRKLYDGLYTKPFDPACVV